jgi:hypothetical protein
MNINKRVDEAGRTIYTLENGSLELSKDFPQSGGAYISLDGDNGVSFYTMSDLNTLIALLTKVRDDIRPQKPNYFDTYHALVGDIEDLEVDDEDAENP